MYTLLEYHIFIFWESGVWWYFHGHKVVDGGLTDDYRSPYQA